MARFSRDQKYLSRTADPQNSSQDLRLVQISPIFLRRKLQFPQLASVRLTSITVGMTHDLEDENFCWDLNFEFRALGNVFMNHRYFQVVMT